MVSAQAASANCSSSWRPLPGQPRRGHAARPDQDHDEQRDQGQHQRGGQPGDVGQAGHLVQPVAERDPDAVDPDQLGHDDAAVEGRGRQHGKRQYRHGETRHHPGRVGRRPPGLAAGQDQHQDDQHGQDGPDLDGAREAERDPAPDQTAGTGTGQPVAVEHGQQPGQAEQHHPGLQQHGVCRLHRGRVDGEDPAGHDHGEQAPVADQQAAHGHCGRASQRGEDPAHAHPPRGAQALGHQRDRRHQQRDARRLDHDEVPVRQVAVDQQDRAAEVRPVVVLGHADQVVGTAQLVEPERDGERGQDHDGRRHRLGTCPAGRLARIRRRHLRPGG